MPEYILFCLYKLVIKRWELVQGFNEIMIIIYLVYVYVDEINIWDWYYEVKSHKIYQIVPNKPIDRFWWNS